MKKRLDNKGFTLVELVIAVAILAIVISPLVANFIQSSKLNLQSRKHLNEMNLAQDVMEGISGYAVKDVMAIVDGVIADSSKSLAGNVLPSAAAYSSVTKTSSPTDEKVVYKMTNVETAGTAHNKYDVVMTFDPTQNDEKEFNDKEVANISEINQFYDAVYKSSKSEIDDAVNALKAKAAIGNTYPKDSYYGKLHRTIKVSILNGGDAANPSYKVRVERIYHPTGELISRASLPLDAKYTATTDNISRMEVDKLPRSVYIYYEGMLNSTMSSVYDHIEVESSTGEDITVYLVRIQDESDPNRESYGMHYGCEVHVTSKDLNDAETQNVHIVSNLRYNLNAPTPKQNFRVKKEDGTEIDDEDCPMKDATQRFSKADTTYLNGRAKYYYNGTVIDEALYQSNFSAGYAKEKKDTLYKVTIDIYNPTSGEKVATYDGGMSN